MFIKICGITENKQAKEIANMGATHIGVIFYKKSPRFVNLQKIKEIKESLPESTKLVAVVVNPSIDEVERLINIADIIQFHGEETLEFIKNFPKEKVIKAFRIKNEKDIEKIKPFIEEGYLILIDAFKEGEYGGTGKQVNPELAKAISGLTDKLILSGGLSPDNITNLVEEIKPFGIDASSKLEIEPGKKDLEKVKEFIKKAKEYYERNN
jgi:phosphoribosylanthranilate isomerase